MSRGVVFRLNSSVLAAAAQAACSIAVLTLYLTSAGVALRMSFIHREGLRQVNHWFNVKPRMAMVSIHSMVG